MLSTSKLKAASEIWRGTIIINPIKLRIMEIRFRIPMAAIYCAAVIFVLSLCGVCISQKVENERLERELREARAEIDNLQDEREQHADYKPLECVMYKRLGD